MARLLPIRHGFSFFPHQLLLLICQRGRTALAQASIKAGLVRTLF
jgi:hypothetical protein